MGAATSSPVPQDKHTSWEEPETESWFAVSRSEARNKLWLPVLVIVLLVIFLVGSLTAVHFESPNPPSEKQKILSPAPEFQYVHIPFLESPRFENRTTEEQVREAWGKYGLASYGFITVPDPEAYDLPPNENVVPGTRNTYMVSVYHQLHCLKVLHLALLPVMMHGATVESGATGDGFEHHHLEHCLDYLRQSVMCSGDVTLEPPDEHPEKGKSPLQGWGVRHVCRSWNEIEGWRRTVGVI
ncbi:hypothetical protein BDV28DRAFT_144878 [Aspergillus coremiiformis]|uniref:Oxidase ustYa n=1 Tax=Aspergillus coremiiformis TaxID=138285 RepID=A0A5N6ZII5_9EURO|nr:hypothetical protein BDV28DRAFT_144878 [Aspergillus coremiiformis]